MLRGRRKRNLSDRRRRNINYRRRRRNICGAGFGRPSLQKSPIPNRYVYSLRNSKVIGHTENEEKDRFRMEKNEGILLMAFWGIAFKIN